MVVQKKQDELIWKKRTTREQWINWFYWFRREVISAHWSDLPAKAIVWIRAKTPIPIWPKY